MNICINFLIKKVSFEVTKTSKTAIGFEHCCNWESQVRLQVCYVYDIQWTCVAMVT